MKNSELAENLAFSLLSHTSLAGRWPKVAGGGCSVAAPLQCRWLFRGCAVATAGCRTEWTAMRWRPVLPEMGAYWCARRLRQLAEAGKESAPGCSHHKAAGEQQK